MGTCKQGCKNGVLSYGAGLNFECICAKRKRKAALKAALNRGAIVGTAAIDRYKAEQASEDYSGLSLYDLASRVRQDWKQPYFGAVPYLQALASGAEIGGDYGQDSMLAIALYFLSNASTWRGPVAKAVKAELNRRVRAFQKGGRA